MEGKLLEYFIINLLNQYILNSISVNQIIEIEKKCNATLQTYWRENNFLTPPWWLLLILCFIMPIIWFNLVDKKRITEITLFGLFYGISAIILDSIGSFSMAWFYSIRITPYLYPELYPYDVCIVIIPYMFVYQVWGNDFKIYFLFTGLLSAFLAFLAEPFLEWLKIYKELTWENIYSFPIYWILGTMCWLFIKQLKKLEQGQ
jgi:hypothetical protein